MRLSQARIKTKTSDVAFANLELGSDYDLLFRWFVGVGIEHMVCDATTFTKNRNRLFEGEWRASSWPGCCLRRAHGLDLKEVKLMVPAENQAPVEALGELPIAGPAYEEAGYATFFVRSGARVEVNGAADLGSRDSYGTRPCTTDDTRPAAGRYSDSRHRRAAPDGDVAELREGISQGRHLPQQAGRALRLLRTGYIEGQSVSIEYRWAEGHYDRLPLLAGDVVGHNVALIVATGDASALAAKNAISTIPVVFFSGGDPVTTGLVASLARPGGNLTGIGIMVVELMQKRVELISELVPQTRVIGLLINPNDPQAERFIRELQSAAHEKRLQVDIMRASTESEIDPVFASFGQLSAGALVVSPSTLFISRREQIVGLASRYAVPAIYTGRPWATAGGLISYGPSVTNALRQLGIYAGKILNGTKPSDLPVQQPTTFELVVNLKTAKALGLTVPPSILARVDEVIE